MMNTKRYLINGGSTSHTNTTDLITVLYKSQAVTTLHPTLPTPGNASMWHAGIVNEILTVTLCEFLTIFTWENERKHGLL